MARISNPELRAQLVEAHGMLEKLNRCILEDHREAMLLPTYPDYAKHAPSAYLDRASAKLQKKGYKVAFAGAMKAGKSTLINALLKAPDLLPAAVYECTLSTTLVSAPKPGQQERVEVTYFSREDGVRNLIDNMRYEDIFKEKAAILTDFDAGKAVDYIRDTIRETRSDSNKQEQLEELGEFVEALEKYNQRLGKVHIDTIHNAPIYLTVDIQRKGMGHLLLIRQVAIYKNNPVFAEDAYEVVDLPGTDSTNPRQRELTHAFMEQADVVFLLLEPKGFTVAAKDIAAKLQEFNQEIRNKIFVIINRWDSLQPKDILKDAIESLYVNEIKARTIKWGLRPDRIFLTSALFEELRTRAELGRLSEQERDSLDKISAKCHEHLASLDQSIPNDLLSRMKRVYYDGGVTYLRQRLSSYLREDIECERLRDVFLDLDQVHLLASIMLGPERAGVAELLLDSRNRFVKVSKLLDEMIYRFDDKIQSVDAKLEKAMTIFMAQAKEQLVTGIKMLVSKDNRNLSIRKIRTGLAVPAPPRIKAEAIATAKGVIGTKLVEAIERSCIPPVVARLTEELGRLDNELVMAHFDKHLGKEFLPRYESIVAGIERDVRQATRLRALEESWQLQNTDMQPAGVEGVWTDALEEEFRSTLQDVFIERVDGHLKRLGDVLWRYYRQLLGDGMREYERMVSELSEAARHAHDVPLPNLGGESEELDRQQRIVEYLSKLDEITSLLGPIKSYFSSDDSSDEGTMSGAVSGVNASIWS